MIIVFIIINKANILLSITSKKIPLFIYILASLLFKILYYIKYYKAYILLKMVTLL